MREIKYNFFESYHKALSRVSDERYGRIVRAMSDYVFTDEEPQFADEGDWVVWELIRPILVRGMEISNVRAEVGREGGLNGKGVSRNSKAIANNSKAIANNSKQKQSNSGVGIGIGNGIGEEKGNGVGVGECMSTHARQQEFFSLSPSLTDIIMYAEEYSQTKGYTMSRDSAEKFFNYYETNGWTRQGKKIKSWKAALRNWLIIDNENKSKSYGTNNRQQNADNATNFAMSRIAEVLA